MNSKNFDELISLYDGLFIWCGIAAILLLLVAVFLFFYLKIPKVFDELTGRGAKKAIAEMTENGASGALTSGNIDQSGKRKGRTGILQQSGRGTATPSGPLTGQPRIVPPPNAQSPSRGLQGNNTAPIAQPEPEYGETAPLANLQTAPKPAGNPNFVVIRSIVEVHSDEVVTE